MPSCKVTPRCKIGHISKTDVKYRLASGPCRGGLLICFLGIFVSYLLFGIMQESIMKTPVDGQRRFKEATCLVLCQSVFNAAVAGIVLRLRNGNTKAPDTIPTFDYALCAFLYMAAVTSSSSALKYVGYPLQVLGKSAKPVAVMLLGVALAKQRYPAYRYVCVLLIVTGVSLFLYKRERTTTSREKTSSNFYGEFLILCSLIFDGLTGAVQDRMRAGHKVSAYRLMFQINVWSSLWSWIAASILGEVGRFADFVLAYPSIAGKILLLSICGAVGQIFIFLTVEWFGPLVCSVITTTRKFFTIFMSVILFKHPLSLIQWFGASLVFAGLALESLYKRK